jgi:hypothetical protein
MCERGELRVRVPGRMVRLLGEFVWAVRAAEGVRAANPGQKQ